ncbi:MAG TPA: thioredoxin-like domain-containing protein [Pyrinomonadaceae bacterium]|nr:thioredoxin-like domain-containing protein [Pyrinomonadaceae bacterium]
MRRGRLNIIRLGIILCVAAACATLIHAWPPDYLSTKGASNMAIPQQGRVRAPELTGGRGWLNTDKPLSLAALKGKVVLLDFWTYGCVNCMHIIPDLKKLEARYANQLVVIGVHSAKFENEKETDNIRRIILRYEIEHPVVNDADFAIWNSYSVRAWPTQVLIDPAGYIVGGVSGEGNYELIDGAIAKVVEEARKRGELSEQPLTLALERAKVGDLPLAFPGKVLADEKGGRLFIADSNHNRIVITKLDGTLLETIGTGARGQADGAFESSSFYRPQGMALDNDSLYVADTENHLIRRIDLKARKVETIAGTGKQMEEYGQSGPARSISLNSPWDLQLVGRTLYIAMAGPHQIWKLDLEKREVSTFAGSGREARRDGALSEAGFAQPSGLATDGKTLYVADSEANIIRAIDLASAKPTVRTLAGGDLFEFGDEDGAGDEVRLQHPLGLAVLDGKVLIADTYNHKIKELDPQEGKVRTLFGKGKPGQADGAAQTFYEPGGLSVAGGKLYVADTNNHAVRVVDLKTGQATTLKLKGLEPPVSAAAENGTESAAPNSEELKLAPQRLRAQADGALLVDVQLPAGYHLNASAPQRYQINVEDGAQRLALGSDPKTRISAWRDMSLSNTWKDLRLPLRVALRPFAVGQAALRVQLTLYYCREDNTGTCQIKTLVWHAPVEITPDANAPTEIRAQGKIQ